MTRTAAAFAVTCLAAAALPAAGCATAAGARPPAETRTITFDSPRDLDAWIAHSGEWKVDGHQLVGRSLHPATDRYSWLTYRTHFAEIDRVVIHGGLDANSPCGFRVGVGGVSVLLNWEIADLNLVHWIGPDAREAGKHALTPGKEHEIVVEQHLGRVRLVVDDRMLWEDEGSLAGTVTVFPAFGSTIRVRDVTVTGRAVPWALVDFPSTPPK